MKPFKGLKYPPPNITALAAAVEEITIEGRRPASFSDSSLNEESSI
jgi:hypothetical protein